MTDTLPPAERIEYTGGYVVQQRWVHDAQRRSGMFDWWDVYSPFGDLLRSSVNRPGAEAEIRRRLRWDREDADAAEFLATLTDEQAAALRHLIAPECCHITGTHDPTHFQEGRYICLDQMAEAYERLRHALRMPKLLPSEATSKSDCGWCRDYGQHHD